MEIGRIYKRTIGLDVHQAQVTACALIEDEDGQIHIEHRQFKTFKRDRKAMAAWIASLKPDKVVMESTSVYWKSPYAALEAVGIQATVVNARHVKKLPGRKTDISDAEWLASLARANLVSASFVPPEVLRGLRIIARERQNIVSMLSAEKNRMHKVLTDGGIRLGVVVSDIHGKSARLMIKALIEQKPSEIVLQFASKRLKATKEQLLDALEGELTAPHLFTLKQLMQNVEYFEAQIKQFDAHLLSELCKDASAAQALRLLQTLPGVDIQGAAMLLVEVGFDMSVFGSAERLSSWVGVCPGNHESAGKRQSGRTRKGNPYVRRLLCEFAHAAARTKSCSLSEKFKSMVVRRGFKRSIVALAHKMLRIIFCMLKGGEYYRDSATDYEALSVKRNASRWIKTLVKHGWIKPLDEADTQPA